MPTSVTTIKVSPDVRDRLKAQATAAHRTLGEHLRHLADLGDRATRFEALRKAIDAMSPADAASYQRELAEWEAVDRG
jgi:predicted transcriptional regulator